MPFTAKASFANGRVLPQSSQEYSMSGTPPASVLKDGNLKASIWENNGQKGIYYTTTFAKVYEDKNGKLRDTNVFNNSDLLKVSELARQAYGRTNELRQEHLQSLEAEQTPERVEKTPAPQEEQSQTSAEDYLQQQRKNQSKDYGYDR